MIHPTKHIPVELTLLGVGAVIITELSRPRTVSNLWTAVRDQKTVGTFERFVLALTMLHSLGAVTYEGGLVKTAAA